MLGRKDKRLCKVSQLKKYVGAVYWKNITTVLFLFFIKKSELDWKYEHLESVKV